MHKFVKFRKEFNDTELSCYAGFEPFRDENGYYHNKRIIEMEAIPTDIGGSLVIRILDEIIGQALTIKVLNEQISKSKFEVEIWTYNIYSHYAYSNQHIAKEFNLYIPTLEQAEMIEQLSKGNIVGKYSELVASKLLNEIILSNDMFEMHKYFPTQRNITVKK